LEDELEEAEEDCWDRADGLRENISMKRIREVAKYGAAFAVGQGVADEKPLYTADDDSQNGRYDCCERV
jgi:hypothetical protein